MERNPELRIYGVSVKIHEEINNIADNLGNTFSDFMKPHLRKIVESYPEDMRKPHKKVVINNDAKVDEKARIIADLCMPCSKEIWGRVYRNAKEVLNA